MNYTLTFVSTPGVGKVIPSGPVTGWEQPGFDDRLWLPPDQASALTGTVPVSILGGPSSSLITAVSTIMPGPTYASAETFRFYVTMPHFPAGQINVTSVTCLCASSDPNLPNQTNFYLNGVQATGVTYNTPIRQFTITFDPTTVVPGKNVLAMTNSKPNVPFYWSCMSFIFQIQYQYPFNQPDTAAAWLIVNEPSIGLTNRTSQLFHDEGTQHSFGIQSRQRGSANYSLRVDASDPYEPTIGSPMFLYDQPPSGFILVFAGFVQAFKNRQIGTSGLRFIDVTATSIEAVFDTVFAEPMQFVDQTCGEIVTALYNAFAFGSQVSLGLISDGPTIPLFNTNYEKLSDLFTQLATTSGFVWGVDPQTQALFFSLPSDAAAPFTLTSQTAAWDSLNWDMDAADYRNRQGMRLSYDAFTHSAEFFLNNGTGTQKQFTLSRPCEQVTNAWVTLSTPNTVTGAFSANPAVGDTITIGPANGAWQASHIYGANGVIVVNGYVQKVTTAGTSGGTIPAFSIVTGATTTDGTVIWTNQGPLGLGTGQQTYTFCGPDNSLTSPHDGQWFPLTAYGAFAELFLIGQQVMQSAGGASGATEPVWPTTIGATVSDGTITWTCLGPWLDNTQFGLVLIDSSDLNTAQNFVDAINSNAATRGIGFSLPTWENSQGNAINLSGLNFTFAMKGAGTGSVASVSTTSASFAWGASQTAGGTSPQGSLGPNEGATISLQVYAVGTDTAAPSLSYTPGSAIVNLATPLSKGNLVVEYTRPDGNVIEVENTALVELLAAVTYGTGKVQQFSDQSSQGLVSTDAASGLQLAQQALAAYDVVPFRITIDIWKGGILPGQEIVIALSAGVLATALNGTYFVDEVEGQLLPGVFPWLDQSQVPGGGHYHYTLTLIDVAQIASVLDFYQGGSGGSGGGGGGSAGGSGLVATTGGQMTDQGTSLTEGGVNDIGAHDYTPSALQQAADYGKLISFNDPTTARTYTLQTTPPFAQWNQFIENVGVANLTVNPGGALLDHGAGGVVIPTNQGIYLSTDGVNYYTSRGLLPVSNVGAMFQIATVTVATLTNKISFPSIPATYNHLQFKFIGALSDGVWQAGFTYVLGTIIVEFFTATSTYYYWKVTTAGVSGGSIPAFSTHSSGTLSDGSVVWTNQGADSATENGINIILNNDLANTNYFQGFVQPAGSGSVNPVGSSTTSPASTVAVMPTPRNARPAIPGSGSIDIPFYKNSGFGKNAIGVSGVQIHQPGSGNQQVISVAIGYLPLSAISQIDFYVGDGTYFAAGTQFFLYGIS